MGYRLYCLLGDLGIDILSVDECIKFLKKFDTFNPYSILLYNPKVDGKLFDDCEDGVSEHIYSEINKKRGMLLWEFMKLGHFDNLSVSAEKLFKNYNSIAQFYKDLNEGGISFIQDLLLEDTEFDEKSGICVDAVLIYETFVYYKEDIEAGIKGVVILKPERTFSVLFANNVTEYKSNVDFLYAVNRQLKNIYYLYPVYVLDDTVSLIYCNNEYEDENSIMYRAKSEYPNIKMVNEENIFNVLLEVVSSNE